MKKSILLLVAMTLVLSASFISATCTLTPQLINQDPYPAVPGDYVKLVFQVAGMQNPDCNQVTFQLSPNYPISFDPGVSPYTVLNGGTYVNNYNSFVMVPYTVRVDPSAVDGNSTLEFDYRANGAGNNAVATYFNLNVQNVKSSFQVFVKGYDYSTNDLTLEILNVGKNDVESLTVTFPQKEDNISVSGPNTYIVGSLSSNDFTTADFKVSPNSGNINMTLSYNDITGVRRSTTANVYFDPTVFAPSKSVPVGLYIVIVLVILLVLYLILRRRKKNKKKKLLRE
jgi:hypothetical protein